MVRAYLRERFPLRVYGPLAAFIALATASRPGGWRPLAVDALFGALLLLQFRTWDDLADRRGDAIAHPERVLARASEVTTVIAFCGALGVLNLCVAVWRDASGIAVGALALLDLALGWLYLGRAGSNVLLAGSNRLRQGYGESAEALRAKAEDPAYEYPIRSLAGDHLLLAKYPAIVFIVAGARALEAPLPIILAAGALYAAACGYEAWHDPGSALARRYPALAAKHSVGER